MVVFTRQLDLLNLKKLDVTASMNDLAVAVNATHIPPRDVAPREITYRNLAQPARITLGRRFGREQVGQTSLTYSGAFAGLYVIQETILAHSATLASAANGDVTNRPVVQLSARITAGDVTNGDVTYFNLVTRVYFGVSSDGGATWAPLASVSRPLGWSSGRVRRIHSTQSSLHFWSGVAGYYPFNLATDRGPTLLASLGGQVSSGSPVGITHYGLMVNSTADFSLLAGTIFLTARDSGL